MSQPRALITGIAGQDGAYLAKLLLDKGYRVAGIDLPGTSVLPMPDGEDLNARVDLIHGNILDRALLDETLARIAPAEVYHLAGRTHVGESFEHPDETIDVNVAGTETLLDAITALEAPARPRIFLASSCEIFGPGGGQPFDEASPLDPQSPYGRSKALAFKAAHDARTRHGLHLSNEILFNHESPLRRPDFVTRKITMAAAAIEAGRATGLALGNLDAARDWGHAPEFAEGMWRTLQQPEGSDYVLATGIAHTVRDFAEAAFAETGRTLEWRGEGAEEVGCCSKNGAILVRVDPNLFRPGDVSVRIGNASKAFTQLGWRPVTRFRDLVGEMVEADRRQLVETKLALAR